MEIDETASGKFPAQFSRKHPHESCQRDVEDVVLVKQSLQPAVIRIAASIPDIVPGQIELFRNTAARVAIANHHCSFRPRQPISNRPQDGQRRFSAVGGADVNLWHSVVYGT